MKVLSFGEILWDIIEGKAHLGGAAFNFAAHSAQCGNDSFMVSRLGDDVLGIRAFAEATALGVKISFIEKDKARPTGTVDVVLNNGQPDYTIHTNVAFDFIDGTACVEALRERNDFDVFYFGSLAQRNTVSKQALDHILNAGSFRHIFYDVNLRKSGFTPEIIRKSLAACTIFKLNHEEVPVIASIIAGRNLEAPALCEYLAKTYPNIETILVTAAENGCYVFADQKMTHVPSTPIQLVDAVGAGDSFSAAFMHVYAHTTDPVHAATVANKVGGFVASNTGPIPKYADEIKMVLKTSTQR